MPVLHSSISSVTRTSSTLKTLTSSTISSAIKTTTSASPAFLPTITAAPSFPAAITSPLATGEVPTPAIAVVVLMAVTVCALILLIALLYFVYLRFRGKCPHCPRYEDELKKWRNGDLKAIRAQMVQERMRAWDLEQGPMDLQAQMCKDRMRMQSLARLEGKSLDEMSQDGRADSVWTEESVDKDKEKEERVEILPNQPKPQKSKNAYVEEDAEATLVNSDFPKSHSVYLKQVVAPREAEAKRSLQEAEEQAINRHLDVSSDPSNRESLQQRAMDKAKEIIMDREARKGTHVKPAPRSRFKEHFSLESDRDS